jgi:pimeloyl-ACP methyl ester carboxylesterase
MSGTTTTATPRPVQIPAGDAILNGDLTIPDGSRGLVVFAHGSGSSRHSTRNRGVAQALQHEHYATLLLDLLTEREERTDVVTAEFRFDIALLGGRVSAALDWARADERTRWLPLGLFGASTGAAAALIVAAEHPKTVRAVVSRGGRPDLAGGALEAVRAPVLLIVGERDDVVIDLNRRALARLAAPAHLVIVPGATHLFEEPGAMEQVVHLALDWFERYVAEP